MMSFDMAFLYVKIKHIIDLEIINKVAAVCKTFAISKGSGLSITH